MKRCSLLWLRIQMDDIYLNYPYTAQFKFELGGGRVCCIIIKYNRYLYYLLNSLLRFLLISKMVKPAQAKNVTPQSSPSEDLKRVVTRHDKQYDMIMALVDLASGVDSIVAANKEYIKFLESESSRLSLKGRKNLEFLKQSSIFGCSTIAKKIVDIMELANMKTYAKWVQAVHQSAANHADDNDKFLCEAEGLVILEEITNQEKVQDFIIDLPSDVDCAIKKKTKLKVVPVKRSPRLLKLKETQEVVHNKKVFPCYEDVEGARGKLVHRKIYVSPRKTYMLPLPKHHAKVYRTSEAMENLRIYYGKVGFQSLVTAMHTLKMIGHAKQAFTKRMDHFMTNGIVPIKNLEGEYRAKKGRPMKMECTKICPTINHDVHNTTSMVTDGIEDAEKALTNEVLRQSEKHGMRITKEVQHALSTLKCYDFYATTQDRNVSRTLIATARLKSLSRRVASRSIRTWATQSMCNIISQFVPGYCKHPLDLTDGARKAWKLATLIYGCPVRPVRARYVINHDGHGGLRTAGRQENKRKKERTGKISSHSLIRHYRNTSSKWTQATAEDEKFKGVGIEVKEINCMAGLRGKEVFQIKGIPPERMTQNMIVMEVVGMGAGQDMVADSTKSSFVTLMKSGGTDELSQETIGAQFSAWYHQNVVLPFITVLRKTDPQFKWVEGAPIPAEMRAVLKFDGEMTYTALLKKLEIASADKRAQIVYCKVAGGYTECGQSNDKSTGFKTSKKFFAQLTDIHNDESTLKTRLKNEFSKLRISGKLNLTTNQRDAIIDQLCIYQEVDRLSNSVESVRMGYVSTGEQSKSKDGKRYYAFPDLDMMTDSNKNEHLKKNRRYYETKLISVGKQIFQHGHAFDRWFDEQETIDPKSYIERDTLEDGKTVMAKTCADTAYHQQRAMFMNWDSILDNMKRAIDESKKKRQESILKQHQHLETQFDLNAAAERKLKMNLKDDQTIADHSTEDHFSKGGVKFSKLNKYELAAFIWLRLNKHLDKPEVPYPEYNRGSAKSISNNEKGPFLFYEAYKLRAKTPTTIHPTLPVEETHDTIPSSPPLFIRVNHNISSQKWHPTSKFIDNAFGSITNLLHRGNIEKNDWKENLESLENDTLRKILMSRLSTHLTCTGKNDEDVNHPIWEWAFSNLGQVAAILKMNKMVKNDATLGLCDSDDGLFQPSFVQNHEMFTSVTEKYLGTYLAMDKNHGYFVRVGSAAVGCDKRTLVGHVKGSKQTTQDDGWSKFYSYYPDKSSPSIIESIRRGWFSDIQFSPGIIFSEENKQSVHELFCWDDDIVAYLDTRQKARTLEYKKHRMVCYLFETALELCLEPKHNVSSSLGFESFIIKINNGFGGDELKGSVDDDGDVVMELD